jgi:hypothetical protein
VWTVRKRDTDPGGCPQFSFAQEQRRVSVLYFYIWDNKMGSGFNQDLHLLPYTVTAWINGHVSAERQALAAGIGVSSRKSCA